MPSCKSLQSLNKKPLKIIRNDLKVKCKKVLSPGKAVERGLIGLPSAMIKPNETLWL